MFRRCESSFLSCFFTVHICTNFHIIGYKWTRDIVIVALPDTRFFFRKASLTLAHIMRIRNAKITEKKYKWVIWCIFYPMIIEILNIPIQGELDHLFFITFQIHAVWVDILYWPLSLDAIFLRGRLHIPLLKGTSWLWDISLLIARPRYPAKILLDIFQ